MGTISLGIVSFMPSRHQRLGEGLPPHELPRSHLHSRPWPLWGGTHFAADRMPTVL